MARRNFKSRGGQSKKSPSMIQTESYAVEAEEIVFQEEAEAQCTKFEDTLIFMYGRPKIGKTELANLFEGIYFLSTEPGLKFQKARRSDIPNWKTFQSFIKKAEKKKRWLSSVNMFAIDTIDNLSKSCQYYVCGREGISHPADLEWGKGWDALKTEFQYWMLRLINLGKGVMFIGHETDKEVTHRSVKITKTMPTIPKSNFEFLNGICDIVMYMGHTEVKKAGSKKKVEKRCLYTKPTAYLEAGERLGKLPAKIVFNTEAEAHKKIIEYF